MKRWWGFVYITIRENIRRKSLYSLVGAYTGSLLLARVLMEFSLQDVTKLFVDFAYSFLVFFLVVSVLFLTADAVVKDMEKKVLYVILSKGVSRDFYVAGRAFSFLFLSFLVVALLGTVFVVFTQLVSASVPPTYSKEVSVTAAVVVLSVMWAKLFLLSTVVLFLSSLATTPFLIFLGSVSIYLAGSSIESLYYFTTVEQEKVDPLFRTVISVLFYVLPSFSSPGPDVILGTESIGWTRVLLDLLKTVSYSLFLVVCSVLLFRRRELV